MSIYQPSVDVLTASVIEAYNGRVLGIMLTGWDVMVPAESTRLKSIGGWTIAQDPLSCTVFGMPKALIDAGGACEIISAQVDLRPAPASWGGCRSIGRAR